jgi:DNA-binding IscR family transcriptional regulator
VFLALEKGPCNIVTLARRTNLSESRLKTLLHDLHRKNLVKVLNQKEKRSSNLIGGGKFYKVTT